jgi:hypothetical protein
MDVGVLIPNDDSVRLLAYRFAVFHLRAPFYYNSNQSLEAEETGVLIRGHWSIENQPYWFLDVCFGEDDCRARTNHAAENLNVLRKTALYLLRKTGVPEKRFGLNRKMLRATLSDDFLCDVLSGKGKCCCFGEILFPVHMIYVSML